MVPLRKIQKDHRDKGMASMATLAKMASGTLRASVNSLKMDFKDLYILCKLGEGQMGKVLLVENKKT